MKNKKTYIDYATFIMFLVNIVLIIIALLSSKDVIKEYAFLAENYRFFYKETVYFIIAMAFFVPSLLGTFTSLANIKLKKNALRAIDYLISVLIIIVIIVFNESFGLNMKGIGYFLLIMQTIIMIILNMYNCMLNNKKEKHEKKRWNINI